jgi:hypothetical protein
VVGAAVGAVVAVAVGAGPVLLQETPFNLKSLGTEFVPVYVPLKPKSNLAPFATDPFHDSLVTVTAAPFCEYLPFQSCETF